MADSDDEYDRKRRDKFRGERTESYQRGEGRRGGSGEDRRREDWIERDSWNSRNRQRTDYREYNRGGGRERYSPARSHDISPPLKRVRSDWEDRRAGGYSHDSSTYGNYGSTTWTHDSYNSQHSYGTQTTSQRDSQLETQPLMMSFKAYLQTQDDNITDEEAIKKYNEYKLEFKRQQLNEFFVTHKDEEWFKIKYHPEDSSKRKEEQNGALKARVEVFLEFLESTKFDNVSVDAEQSENLIKLLDAAVIRLEGGTDFDMQILEQQHPAIQTPPANEEKDEEKEVEEVESKPFILGGEEDEKKKEKEKPPESEIKKDPTQPLKLTISSEQVELQEKAKEFLKQKSASVELGDIDEEAPEPKKRKREYEYESGSESGDEQPVVQEEPKIDEPPPPGLEEGKEAVIDLSNENDESKEEITEKEINSVDEAEVTSRKDEESDEEGEDKSEREDKEKTPEIGKKDESGDEDKKSDVVDDQPKPRPLHRTSSIFLRNLAPTITKQEVEAMCKRYPGFLRVAIADPQPERKWFRRGWVTFERQVNIKEICWNLNNIRLRDCELGAIVNRDLSRRIRTVNGITGHRQVVRHDIKLSAKIVHNLDTKNGLWMDPSKSKTAEEKKSEEENIGFGLASSNPVLKNITDYLIEEGSAEEEELLGLTSEQEEGQNGDEANVDRDEILIKVLDKLIFYLRLVHSVDYYNHCEYPNEDEMPNRCGIMHARSNPPSSKVTQQEISDYTKAFESKIASFLQPTAKISEEEYSKLGHKNAEEEVEKFIQANTQELAKDKWLCPLSGKKFKGPEFVRKHIFNKHAEKIEEVKKEVEYFNNYLRDPKRPQLPEHPGNRPQRKEGMITDQQSFSNPTSYAPIPQYQYSSGYGRHMYSGQHYGGGYGYNQGYNQGYGRPRGYGRGRSLQNGSTRPLIAYHDLDAPEIPEVL